MKGIKQFFCIHIWVSRAKFKGVKHIGSEIYCRNCNKVLQNKN